MSKPKVLAPTYGTSQIPFAARHADLLILTIVASGPRHGYAMAQRLQRIYAFSSRQRRSRLCNDRSLCSGIHPDRALADTSARRLVGRDRTPGLRPEETGAERQTGGAGWRLTGSQRAGALAT